MILSALRLKLAPYALAAKIGAVALVFALGLRAGCSWQGHRDAAALARKDSALQSARASLTAAAGALRQVDANTAAEIARASARAAANADAAAKAKKAAKEYLERLVEVEGDLEEAKRRSPACRAKLEERPCATLH